LNTSQSLFRPDLWNMGPNQTQLYWCTYSLEQKLCWWLLCC